MTEHKLREDGDKFVAKVRKELEKLTGSVDIMMENLRKMEHPILESQKSLPKANKQLDKVSRQTEKATHQMLDMVEQIIEHQEKVVEFSKEIAQNLKADLKQEDIESIIDKANQINETASNSQNNAFLIMDALQFQDITSQQMNHASSLLEEIETRLHNLLKVFEGEEDVNLDNLEDDHKKQRVFDPEADLFDGRDQDDVDSIVSEAASKE